MTYECPDHGKGWIFDWVGATPHGGERRDQARLRTFAEVRREAMRAIAVAAAITEEVRVLGRIEELASSLDALQDAPRHN